jgi:hypothetical protein
MLLLPLASDWNTIRRPSGDHLGLQVLFPNDVSENGCDPSLLQIQISRNPDLAEVNAILVPSGENLGSYSGRVEEMNFIVSVGLAPKTGTTTRQILLSVRPTS